MGNKSSLFRLKQEKKMKQIINCMFVKGMTIHETAKELGIGINTVCRYKNKFNGIIKESTLNSEELVKQIFFTDLTLKRDAWKFYQEALNNLDEFKKKPKPSFLTKDERKGYFSTLYSLKNDVGFWQSRLLKINNDINEKALKVGVIRAAPKEIISYDPAKTLIDLYIKDEEEGK